MDNGGNHVPSRAQKPGATRQRGGDRVRPVSAVLWVIGQTAFPFQANGSMVKGAGRQAGRVAADRAALYQG